MLELVLPMNRHHDSKLLINLPRTQSIQIPRVPTPPPSLHRNRGGTHPLTMMTHPRTELSYSRPHQRRRQEGRGDPSTDLMDGARRQRQRYQIPTYLSHPRSVCMGTQIIGPNHTSKDRRNLKRRIPRNPGTESRIR